jgi:Zn-dependent protease
MDMSGYWYAVKRYFRFNPDEIKGLVITTIIFGFMLSFREWGAEEFNLSAGLINFINATLVVGLALLFRESIKRLFAIKKGYYLEYKTWIYGIMFALILAFVTRGYVVLLLPGAVILYHATGLRLGRFRYWTNQYDIFLVSIMGPAANIILAAFFKYIAYIIPDNSLVAKAITVNLWMAVLSGLPIPYTDGGNAFYSNRALWALGYGAIVFSAILLYFLTSVFWAILAGIVMGIICMIFWYMYVE